MSSGILYYLGEHMIDLEGYQPDQTLEPDKDTEVEPLDAETQVATTTAEEAEVSPLQHIAHESTLIAADKIGYQFTKSDLDLLKSSGLARFDANGNLVSVSSLAMHQANYRNFGILDSTNVSIIRLASELKSVLAVRESAYENATRGV